jgi:hypothetical protein
MTLYGWRLTIVVLCALAIWLGWNPDARFESSDQGWWDSTSHFKDRNFDHIQREFQVYRMTCKRPTATLVRTTAVNPLAVTAWPWYVFKQERRMPYASARPLTNVSGSGRPTLSGEVVCRLEND